MLPHEVAMAPDIATVVLRTVLDKRFREEMGEVGKWE